MQKNVYPVMEVVSVPVNVEAEVVRSAYVPNKFERTSTDIYRIPTGRRTHENRTNRTRTGQTTYQRMSNVHPVTVSDCHTLSDCHSLPDSANGRVTDSKILCLFVSVRVRSHAFLVRSSCGECVPCQVVSVLSGPIRWHVLDMFKTSNGRHRIKMSGG